MKCLTTSLMSLAALSTTAWAQANQGLNQSLPFYLVAISKDQTINGSFFSACHEGAETDALCPFAPPIPANQTSFYTYQLNYTGTSPDQGVLSYNFSSGNWLAMSLTSYPSSNVALPLLTPSANEDIYTFQEVGFDKNNRMYIPAEMNDRVNPPTTTGLQNLYNWYSCKIEYEGTVTTTLGWTFGTEFPPQNPSCVAIEVVRTNDVPIC